jgi:hypothetical protein
MATVSCEICYSRWNNYVSLNNHISQIHKLSSKEYYDRFLKKEGEGVCVCGKNTYFKNMNLGYCKYCSSKCSNSNLIVKSRKKQSYLTRYGVDHPLKDGKIFEKLKTRWFVRYGVDNPSKNIDIKKKKRDTCIERYGVDNPSKMEEVKRKKEVTCLKNFGVKWPGQIYGYSAYANSCVKNPSKPQVELFNLTKSIYDDAVLNYSCLNYSIDIAIPSLKVGIEYDGSYWHRDKGNDDKRQKEIETEGWKVIRYRDFIPKKEELLKNIEECK